MPREISIENHLVNVCERFGAWAVKGENVAGFPDRIVMAPGGRVCFVELKAPHGRLSKIQKRIHKALRALGQDVRVLWNRDEVDHWAAEYFG